MLKDIFPQQGHINYVILWCTAGDRTYQTATDNNYQPATGEVDKLDGDEGVRSSLTAMWKSPSYSLVHAMPFITSQDKMQEKLHALVNAVQK